LTPEDAQLGIWLEMVMLIILQKEDHRWQHHE
jgi:hypothetical protein